MMLVQEEMFGGGSTKLIAQTSVNATRDTSRVVKLDPIHPVHFKL